MVFESEYDAKSSILRISCVDSIYGPSVEDYDVVMSVVIDKLLEIGKPTRFILTERRENEYSIIDSKLLLEIGNAVEKIIKKKIISLKNMITNECDSEAQERYGFLKKSYCWYEV